MVTFVAVVDLADVVVRLGLALGLGLVVGIEREWRGHSAGMGTHTLVALGAAVFTLAGAVGVGDSTSADPWRIAAQVASGIGFIGAGTIIQSRGSVKGLTTAASLWFIAGVGVAAGTGALAVAALSAIAALFVLEIREYVKVPDEVESPQAKSVTVWHADRDALIEVVSDLLTVDDANLSLRTEPGRLTDDGERGWRTIVTVDRREHVARITARLQRAGDVELTVEDAPGRAATS